VLLGCSEDPFTLSLAFKDGPTVEEKTLKFPLSHRGASYKEVVFFRKTNG